MVLISCEYHILFVLQLKGWTTTPNKLILSLDLYCTHFIEFEELPRSQGGNLDNTDNLLYHEEWTDSEHLNDDPNYTPGIEDSQKSSEAGSENTSQNPNLSVLTFISYFFC